MQSPLAVERMENGHPLSSVSWAAAQSARRVGQKQHDRLAERVHSQMIPVGTAACCGDWISYTADYDVERVGERISGSTG